MNDVLIRRQGAAGRITLNRPQALNALTLDMVRAIYDALHVWSSDPQIKFILIDGAGERGLCAGGDIRTLYTHVKAGDLAAAATFLREEYRLNHLVATYPKPYIAIMDGIVMGGGIGLSAHASHRIVTERSTLAMPETAIGFITDVGGTHLLGTAPGELGTYLALTGDRIYADDAILCGLADTHVPSTRLHQLMEKLAICSDAAEIHDAINTFRETPPAGKLPGNRFWIDKCFAASSVEEILKSLQTHSHEEAHTAATDILKNSPTSLKITLLALRRAHAFQDLVLCLQQEYRAGVACFRHGDFLEGVRATVIDKDRHPAWKPASLDEVTSERVESFFSERVPELALAAGWFS